MGSDSPIHVTARGLLLSLDEPIEHHPVQQHAAAKPDDGKSPSAGPRPHHARGDTEVSRRIYDRVKPRHGCNRDLVLAGLQFHSRGRYITRFERALFAPFLEGHRTVLPFPRRPWDPRAVSDPRLVAGELFRLEEG
jgi:hypothetical protein